MSQPINDYPAFFDGAKLALAEVSGLKEEEEQLKTQEAATRSALESEQKALKDQIDLTLKKRSQEITGTYDAEIAKGNEELKKVKARRERAKNAGIRERIKDETAGYLKENETLKAEMVEAFRKQHIPMFYRTRLYYALFFPHKFTDFLVLLLFILICFGAVPCGIYFFALPEKFRMIPVLVGIYVASILLFGGIFMWISNSSKLKYMEMLRQGRAVWDQIALNKKAVKRITKQISRDKSEDKYNLGSFDDEIAHINQKIYEATSKKQEALNTFENVTKNIITDELTQNARPRIEQLTSDHAVAMRRLQEVSASRQQKTLAMNDTYEVYLGKEFMNEEKIDALKEIMEHGTVTNISEAIEEYRSGKDE